jgi:hypothetical protein
LSLFLLIKNRVSIRNRGEAFNRFQFLVADYQPSFFYWDQLEMLRKAAITGLIMFVKKGSLVQLVLALLGSLVFGFASAWLQPYASGAANVFKVGTEMALLMTLTLAILLRVDFDDHAADFGTMTNPNDFVGLLLFASTTAVPAAALVIGIMSNGFSIAETMEEIAVEENAIAFENPLEEKDL